MKKLLFAMTFVISASLLAWGDAIPYPNIGTLAPTQPLQATSTGEVTGYFYAFSAQNTDTVAMCDVSTDPTCSGLTYALDNQTTGIGDSFDFGPVTAGDSLVFFLDDVTTHNIFASDPSFSVDGINHAYVTGYTGVGAPPQDAGIPPGTYIGMEDSLHGGDFDYNDSQFVFTNVSSVPEPSLLLLCAGLLVALPILRRKLHA